MKLESTTVVRERLETLRRYTQSDRIALESLAAGWGGARALGLSSAASLLCELCDGKRTIAQICAAAEPMLSLPAEQVEIVARTLFEQLIAQEFYEIGPGADASPQGSRS